jgi:hypothetical protein
MPASESESKMNTTEDASIELKEERQRGGICDGRKKETRTGPE